MQGGRGKCVCVHPAAMRPQEKQSEISELQTRLAAAADKGVALTESNASLDAQLHEAQAAASRAALTQARLEQEKGILEKSNAWLSQVRGGVWGCRCRCRCKRVAQHASDRWGPAAASTLPLLSPCTAAVGRRGCKAPA